MKKYILTWKEFLKELKMSYFELVGYLKKKYGMVWYNYGNDTDKTRGLFAHHIMEYWIANLSSPDGQKEYPEYQRKGYLVFCNWLEHLLLHIKIHQDINSPRRIYADTGITLFLIPQLYAYLEMNLKTIGCSNTYYNNISNKAALRIFKYLVSLFKTEEYTDKLVLDIINEAEYNFELDVKNKEKDLHPNEMAVYKLILSGTRYSNSEIEVIKEYYPKYGPKYTNEKLMELCGSKSRSTSTLSAKATSLGYGYSNFFWNKDDTKVFKKYYIKYGSEYVQKILLEKYNKNKSLIAIQDYASKLGLVRQESWSQEEINILTENYGSVKMSVLMEMLPKRTELSIRCMCHSLQLRTDRVRPWTKKEDKILKEKYLYCDRNELCKIFPYRTLTSILARIQKLSIKSGRYNPWTDEEIQILKDNYSVIGLDETVKLLPNRNASAVRLRANKLHLYVKPYKLKELA